MDIDPALLTVHVRTIREQRGRSLVDVAQVVGLSRSELARAEVGASDFHVQDLARLARVLETNPWHLITFVGYPLPCGCCCHRTPEETP